MIQEYIGNLVFPDRILCGGKIVCENGRIVRIETGAAPDGEDLPYILPGLVDIHHHGGVGHDYMESTAEAFDAISQHLARHGVTAGLCTTVSAHVEDILAFLSFYRSWQAHEHTGCRYYGVHLEGPFIAPASRGAHPLETLRRPVDGYDFVLKNNDIVRHITIAPELEGMSQMIRDLKAAGITVSGGHDKAEPEDIEAAIAAGMSHCTHIYCAMSTLHKTNAHRRCGLCEYGMTSPELSVEMIADNHHVPPRLAQIIYNAKGPKKACMVSDAISPAGFPESDQLYKLGTGEDCTKVFVEGGVALVEDKSCYAGSVQSLDQMIRNVVFDAGIPLCDAVRMASLTPAEVIGIDGEVGSLEAGKRADLCFMDAELQVIKTVIGGCTVYEQ